MEKIIRNRYLLVRKIGEGGMADVFLAMDTVLNREVALKLLRGELSSDPVALLRFQREANAASGINHANVVEIYDVGEDHGMHYIVMEYIRGKTLKQLITQRGALEKEEAVNIMKQLVSAIGEAHDKDIIHRDIKPQNIMIKDDGTVKVTDFGIAMASDALQLTQSDSVMGSVHYLAPECARGENASFQSDIYSLGIVMYEMLTGQVPHRGDAPIQIAMKHMKEEIPSIRKINPLLPVSLDNIITKATAKNKINRYPDTHAFYQDLEVALSSEHQNDEPLVFHEEVDENAKTLMFNPNAAAVSPKKRFDAGKIAIISFLVIALIVSGVLIFTFTRPRTPVVYTIPNVVGSTLEQAQTQMLESGFVVSLRYGTSDDYAKDVVFKTTPEAGVTKAEKGYSVILYISQGKSFVVGNYVGQNATTVKAMLEGLAEQNIRINVDLVSVQNTGKPAGTIVSQKSLLEGTEVPPNNLKTIQFEVAANTTFYIPNLLFTDINTAATQLENMGGVVSKEVISTVGKTPEEIALLQKNVVIEMSPKPGLQYEQTTDSKIILKYYE